MLRLEVSTQLLSIINPGLYGREIDIREECYNDFKKDIAKMCVEHLNELFKENDLNIKCFNPVFKSPSYFNYENDWVEFNIEVPDDFINQINVNNEEMYKSFNDLFGSHEGFVSFMPCEKEEYINALSKKADTLRWELERAIAMYITYLFKDSIDEINSNFWEDVEEHAWHSDYLYEEGEDDYE